MFLFSFYVFILCQQDITESLTYDYHQK